MHRKIFMTCLAGVLVLTIGFVQAQEPATAGQAQEPGTQAQEPGTQGQPDELDRSARQAQVFFGYELERIQRGYAIAPVPLDLEGRNPALVGLGSYLVNAAGGCNDCHTNPQFEADGDPFKGQPKKVNAQNYLAGGAPFGPFVSRNLTPDPQSGLPAGLTYQEFRRTMRTGVDLKNAHPEVSPLLQVMPWPVYQEMSERDMRAIYEFLRAIPHAEPAPPPPSVPPQ